MRKPVIAGNWKMHKTRDEALQFIYSVNQEVPEKEYVDTVIAPQDPILRDLVKRQGDHLRIGAQNMHEKTEGAFTGETSAAVLENLGVEYVIIGHSERRAMFNDTDERVNKKLHQAFRYGITPILCVGEALETREAGETDIFVKGQVNKALKGLGSEQVKSLVIAYEPIWAIGTGKTATSEQAEETIRMIRETLSALYDPSVGDATRILYGGSVKPANIDELLAQENIDGALVGGASLDPKSFLTLVEAATKK
ncbi:MAG: triose-phosphate isomerase [Bacillota bacterium]